MDRTAGAGAVGVGASGSAAEAALEAAAEEWEASVTEDAVCGDFAAVKEATRRIVGRYLDALLEGLPEEAVEAVAKHRQLPPHAAAVKRPAIEDELCVFLRSLRGSEGE